MLKISISFIIISFLMIPCALAGESITMTTYYPAPNGDYTNLKSDKLLVSNNMYVFSKVDPKLGKVGIGYPDLTTLSDRLQVAGNVKVETGKISVDGTLTNDLATSTGHVEALAFFYRSDKRLKDHITPITDGLEKVLALRGVSFNFKNSPDLKRIGLIAQEVEAVVPDVVITGEDGFKSVEYGNLVAILIEAVKAQQKEIDVLKKKVENLEAAGE